MLSRLMSVKPHHHRCHLCLYGIGLGRGREEEGGGVRCSENFSCQKLVFWSSYLCFSSSLSDLLIYYSLFRFLVFLFTLLFFFAFCSYLLFSSSLSGSLLFLFFFTFWFRLLIFCRNFLFFWTPDCQQRPTAERKPSYREINEKGMPCEDWPMLKYRSYVT